MNWFEAFQHVNAELLATNDDELIDAWCIFLRSPFPHLANPPAADGAPGGKVRNFAEKFMETAETWGGRGVELLLFRLVQTNEAIIERLDAHLPRRGTASSAAAVMGSYPVTVEDVPWVADEAHQVSYCDGCGLPLHPNGGCLRCGQ